MNPLTASHRRQQLALRAVKLKELQKAWSVLDPARLDATYPAWENAVKPIVSSGRQMSSVISSRYVQAIRADAGIPGVGPVAQGEKLKLAVLRTSLSTTGPVAIKKSMTRGVPLEQATRSAFVLSSNAATRHILDGGRNTVIATVEADPDATGWKRVTSGGACKFCQALAADEKARFRRDFKCHDGCACSVEPVFERSSEAAAESLSDLLARLTSGARPVDSP